MESRSARFSRILERVGFLAMTVSITVLLFLVLVLAFNFGIVYIYTVAGLLFLSICSVIYATTRFSK